MNFIRTLRLPFCTGKSNTLHILVLILKFKFGICSLFDSLIHAQFPFTDIMVIIYPKFKHIVLSLVMFVKTLFVVHEIPF